MLKSIEDKSQALKSYLPLGQKKKHYHPKSVADSVLSAAEWIIKYLATWDDWKAELCLKPSKWRNRDEYRKSVEIFRKKLGSDDKGQLAEVEAGFREMRYILLRAIRERWKLIPDLPMPKKFCRDTEFLSRKRTGMIFILRFELA